LLPRQLLLSKRRRSRRVPRQRRLPGRVAHGERGSLIGRRAVPRLGDEGRGCSENRISAIVRSRGPRARAGSRVERRARRLDWQRRRRDVDDPSRLAAAGGAAWPRRSSGHVRRGGSLSGYYQQFLALSRLDPIGQRTLG
jgi:hypothetical protein